MINRAAITAWKEQFPWKNNEHIEQDLLICRALVAIFSDEFLASALAFRGGTALHKLYLSPQPRYSEDIDLVQINAGPIKPIMQRLGEVLDFLPDRVTKQKRYNNTMLFRMESEIPPVMPMRLKVEINCFEHFNELGLISIPFEMSNSWFSGKCKITTYHLDELLGTKLRALYQRRKGRDLFDLQRAINGGQVNPENVVRCYQRYIGFSVDNPPTKKQFILNMEEKMQSFDFLNDTKDILHPSEHFNPQEAYKIVCDKLIERL